MTTPPLTDVQLREAFTAAITADACKPSADRVGLVDAMLAVVWPELDRLRAELAGARQELATAQTSLDAVHALLPDDPDEDIDASWLDPRWVRDALARPSLAAILASARIGSRADHNPEDPQ
ncbi:hypothetical protein [Kitasatospora sp. NPDC050543]|uniref:hypothetical protein n=1 Tax=Kitasatospora sp. NPDC050543 TaxID=3364054 RepID=UPI003791DA6A